MRTLRKLLAVTVLAAVPVAALAAPVETAANKGKAPVTMADFAVMLAASKGIEAGRSAELLARAGVPLGDLQAPLTEGRLAESSSITAWKPRRLTRPRPSTGAAPNPPWPC